ncbi:MAG TPA: SPOR domain-containing protein [Gemmatimonadaceae bacterium]|nr:SPOR domain-containing protein [Gemmatimonadaceae bacterium]
MRWQIALALALVACSRGERSDIPATRTATTATAQGPDALMLRAPRSGGVARVVNYPNIDSTIWTASDAGPALDRVLAFDADNALIAAVDSRGFPLWLDLHVGTIARPGRASVRNLTSIDGSNIYGVGSDGAVVRYAPPGNWVYKPRVGARAVYPQSNGNVIVLAGTDEKARAWRMHPPDTTHTDSVSLPDVTGGVGAPLGDRIYFITKQHALLGLRPRTMAIGRRIAFDSRLAAMVASPSGDRFYVLPDSAKMVSVVDRYQDRVTAHIVLPDRARDLRVDPFGRYLLVRAAEGDSVWVVSIGTDEVVGTVRSQWRRDLPLVAQDGAIAVLDGADVAFLGGMPFHEVRRARGGASDYWYPFVWDGFRPRAAALDQPVQFPADSDSIRAAAAESAAAHPAAPPAAAPAPARDTVAAGFTVSFAALLDQARANDEASKIVVDGRTARVVTSLSNGMTIYRVVLGPFATREEADRIGRASGHSYYVYAGAP